jgi:hypothetical protein
VKPRIRSLRLPTALALVAATACIDMGVPLGPARFSTQTGVASDMDVAVIVPPGRPCGGMCPPPPPTDTISMSQKIIGVVTLDPSYLYIMKSTVVVGDEAGQPGELVIPAGTRIEGRAGTSLVVNRNGRIRATGTLAKPVYFTCVDPGDGRYPGCWQGLVMAGTATLLTGDPKLGPAPLIPVRNPKGGGLQDARAGIKFGGKNDADYGGSLNYVLIANGGNPSLGLGSLTLGACGSNTILQNVQVQGSLGKGLEVIGGKCSVQQVVVK